MDSETQPSAESGVNGAPDAAIAARDSEAIIRAQEQFFLDLQRSEDAGTRFASPDLNVKAEIVSDLPSNIELHSLSFVAESLTAANVNIAPAETAYTEIIVATNRSIIKDLPTGTSIADLTYWRFRVQGNKIAKVGGPFHTIGEAGLNGGHSFVYIHGYKNSLEAAIDSAARVASTKVDGSTLPVANVVCFCWPSQDSYFQYNADEKTALGSSNHLVDALKAITAQAREPNDGSKVHLFAHSLGNRLTIAALDTFVRDEAERQTPGIGSLFFVAADVAQPVYRKYLDSFARLGYSVNSYACDSDKALLASSLGREYRGGRYEPIACSEWPDSPYTTLLWEGSSCDSYGHSYFYEVTVIKDWINVINGKSINERGLKQKQDIEYHFVSTYFIHQ